MSSVTLFTCAMRTLLLAFHRCAMVVDRPFRSAMVSSVRRVVLSSCVTTRSAMNSLPLPPRRSLPLQYATNLSSNQVAAWSLHLRLKTLLPFSTISPSRSLLMNAATSSSGDFGQPALKALSMFVLRMLTAGRSGTRRILRRYLPPTNGRRRKSIHRNQSTLSRVGLQY